MINEWKQILALFILKQFTTYEFKARHFPQKNIKMDLISTLQRKLEEITDEYEEANKEYLECLAQVTSALQLIYI